MHDYVRILTACVCVSVIELSNLPNCNSADLPSLLNGNSCVSAELPFGRSLVHLIQLFQNEEIFVQLEELKRITHA